MGPACLFRLFCAALAVGAQGQVAYYTVATLAGNGSALWFDGAGAGASFSSPYGVAVDASGNVIVADFANHRIRKVSPLGVVTTLAGSGANAFADGAGAGASFSLPFGVAVDASGNMFVADYGNHRVRKVSPGGVVSTLAGNGSAMFADGGISIASFYYPRGVAVDASGNVIVADAANHRIRKVTPGGMVSTLAGSGAAAFADGSGVAASFNNPSGVAVDASGNVFVADSSNHRIRKVTPGGAVSTLAGSGGGRVCRWFWCGRIFQFPFRRGRRRKRQCDCCGSFESTHPQSDTRGRGYNARGERFGRVC